MCLDPSEPPCASCVCVCVRVHVCVCVNLFIDEYTLPKIVYSLSDPGSGFGAPGGGFGGPGDGFHNGGNGKP